MEEFNFHRIWETLIAILLATAGGFARLLHVKDKRKMKTSLILSRLFVSAFAGLMILLLARISGLTGDWIGLVSGIAGWLGPQIIDRIAKPAMKPVGIDMDEKKEEEVK